MDIFEVCLDLNLWLKRFEIILSWHSVEYWCQDMCWYTCIVCTMICGRFWGCGHFEVCLDVLYGDVDIGDVQDICMYHTLIFYTLYV